MFHVKHSVTKVNVSRETLERIEMQKAAYKAQFEHFADQILLWNKKINLISRGIHKDELMKHIHHSLMIQYSELWSTDVNRVIDAGTGGGLPGIPLAIVSQNEFLMVDIVEKKMLALGQIIKNLKLTKSMSRHQNIQSVESKDGDLYISKHAFKLNDFFNLTKEQRYIGAIFLKGEGFIDEINACDGTLEVKYIALEEIHKDTFFSGKYVLSIKRID